MLFLLIFAACGQVNKNEAIEAKASSESSAAAADQLSSQEKITAERKLIREGSITMEVKDLKQTENELKKILKAYNAYLTNNSQYVNQERNEVSNTIRIPAKEFDNFCDEIVKLAVKVDLKNLNITDITEEYIDIEARLKTKKALEQRFIGLLAQTKNINEILNVEKELETVRSDIESMEARMKLLGNQTQYASLQLNFYVVKSDVPNFWRGVGQGLAGGWMALMKFALILIRAWPFVLILSVILYFGRKRFKRSKS